MPCPIICTWPSWPCATRLRDRLAYYTQHKRRQLQLPRICSDTDRLRPYRLTPPTPLPPPQITTTHSLSLSL